MPSHYPINSSSLGFTSSISSTAVGSSAFVGGSSSYTRTATGAYANGNGASYSGKDYEALGKLQDVVWSDEEEEPECPLCMEELDPSDVHFKPCVCGYQVSSALTWNQLSSVLLLSISSRSDLPVLSPSYPYGFEWSLSRLST